MTRKKTLLFLILTLLTLSALQTKAQNDSLLREADKRVLLLDSVVHWQDASYLEGYGSKTEMTEKNAALGGSQDTTHTTVSTTQKLKIKGVVKDKNTGEGVPFALVFFPNSGLGTSADIDGKFELAGTFPHDTLRIQAIGYDKVNIILKRASLQPFYTLELERMDNQLAEFVFKAGEDPAIALVKKIIAHKPQNNPDRLENYKYQVYNKLEVDLERLTRKQFESLPIPLMRKFSFIYDNLDTTEETPFLPLYFTETLSDYYFQHNPKKTKEFIIANQLKGIDNKSITPFLGSMYQNVNAYNNFISVMDKSYVSPISNSGLFYYHYKIKDTQEAYGQRILLVQFSPKRSGENCFSGDFWVADSVFALQRISLQVPKDANINWVNNINLYQEFAPVNDTLWFCIKDKFIAHFVAPYGVKLPGFIGRKTTSYRNIVVNDSLVAAVVNNPDLKEDVMVADTARAASEAFWSDARHDSLSKNEKAIYKMMDTLNSMPLFQTYKNMIKFITIGVKDIGPLEIGPYWYLYSRNPIEGNRFRLPLGTTPQLFKDIYLKGYVAYGDKDKEFKYNAEGLWLLQHHPRMYIDVSHTQDVDRSSNYYNGISFDNIFSTLVRKPGIPWKLTKIKDSRLEFYKEYFSGFSHMLVWSHRETTPFAPLPASGIFYDQAGNPTDHVTNSEGSIRLRYAYKEKWLEGNYYRVSLGSKYPIAELRYGMGFKNVFNSNYAYQKLSFSISDRVKIAPLGSVYYQVFAGKYWGGALPYLLLEIHPGNEFYAYNSVAFNMMNRFEFVSDQYAGFTIEHSLGGGLFNYIPYFKRIKLRQFWTAKGIIGSLNAENQALNSNKGFPFRTLQGNPYIELGTGVENILQLFRIDFVWRVTPKALPDEPREKYFGIFGSVKLNF
jgi:hypothetical protein